MEGRKYGGRKKGVPNKATTAARVQFAKLWEEISPDIVGWINAAAEKDPAEGARLALAAAEFFVPKLRRNETTLKASESFAKLVLGAQRQREEKPT